MTVPGGRKRKERKGREEGEGEGGGGGGWRTGVATDLQPTCFPTSQWHIKHIPKHDESTYDWQQKRRRTFRRDNKNKLKGKKSKNDKKEKRKKPAAHQFV